MKPPSTPVLTEKSEFITPPRLTTTSADEALKSNACSASVTEYLSSIASVGNYQCTKVPPLLTYFLTLCLPDEQRDDPPSNLLGQCLQAVLPVCNVGTSVRGEQKETDGSMMRHHLDKYCKVDGREEHRYPPFVLAFNYALHALARLDALPLRGVSPEEIMFRINESGNITAEHHGLTSIRKPDIVICSLESARRVSKDGDLLSWEDLAFHAGGRHRPFRNIEWDDLRCVVEMKRMKPSLAKAIYPYRINPIRNIAAQRFPSPDPNAEAKLPPLQIESELEERNGLSMHSLPTKPGVASRRVHQSARIADKPPAAYSDSGLALPRSASSSATRKRKQETEPTITSKKYKSQPEQCQNKAPYEDPTKMPAMIQSALYATEMKSRAFWISHVINLVVIDKTAYIWWYDAQCAIQSQGIDLIRDLPYFLVLLLCFQRFTKKNWGIIPEFKPKTSSTCSFTFPVLSNDALITASVREAEVEAIFDAKGKFHSHYGLHGRGTQMVKATSDSPDPRNPERLLSDRELVAKISWPEESWIPEPTILARAAEIAENDDRVKGHIPSLIAKRDLIEYSTSNIRIALCLCTKGSRVIRFLLLPELSHITNLIGDDFWRTFWECFHAHLGLWEGGVQHNDISVKNLMYDAETGKAGVLNDFDLAHLIDSPRPSGMERTGTLPFMAFDLLCDAAWEGHVERLYRHDWESFFWVLLWVSCRYMDGVEIPNPPFNDWVSGDYRTCSATRFGLFMRLGTICPTSSYSGFWPSARKLVVWIVRTQLNKGVEDGSEELTIAELVQLCYKLCKEGGTPAVERPHSH